ncbi:hypothetical protein FPV67DRAFT_1422033 [Lyophyllum atratum]|nr:hypothetical protein FPV67DRAFT_1422033 [Lyophyllum atratum]
MSSSSPAGPESAGPEGDEHLLQFLAAYKQLSDAQRKTVDAVIAATDTPDLTLAAKKVPAASTIVTSSVPRLFSAAREKPAHSSTGAKKFGFHPALQILASNDRHIPLTMFLAKSLKRIHMDEGLDYETLRMSAGNKVTVLKTKTFPDEKAMDAADWLEGWKYFKEFLGELDADEAVLKRWNFHFDFVTSHDDFKDNFPTVLRFDIEQRREYAAYPTQFDERIYFKHWHQVQDAVRKDEFLALKRSIELAARTTPSKPRFEPYSSPSTSKSQSFPKGSGGAVASSLCLICGRHGHRYGDCTFDQDEQGKPVIVKISPDRRLASIASNTPVCVSWNLGGSGRCNRPHLKWHTCSRCGTKVHFACSSH